RVWYQGKKQHPLVIEKIHYQALALADYFEFHHRTDNVCFSEDGERISQTLLISDTNDKLRRKADAYLALARNYLGILGRAPDYINVVLSTWAGNASLFGTYSQNVRQAYQSLCKNDFFITHSTAELKGGSQTGIQCVRETDSGIYLSGARAMATSAALSDEIFIAPTRTSDSEPEKAIVCLVPSSSDGLNIVCRENFSGYSHLARFYDESDALLTLDNVFVPWEKVLIYRDVDLYNSIVKKTATSPACSLQTNARAIAKLETVIALGQSWVKIQKPSPEMEGALCDALRDLTILKSLQNEALLHAETVGGCQQPNSKIIETAKIFFMESYPKTISSMRELWGPHLLYLFEGDDLVEDIIDQLSVQWGIANSDVVNLQKRLLPLFDLLLSSFGSRHELYEKHYAGTPKRVFANYWKTYGPHFDGHETLKHMDQSKKRLLSLLGENKEPSQYQETDQTRFLEL
ncbi:MAG: 4-hydroxyphenylacetate 3-hydroxylase N-terminal domain-containing protein, partial [Pseudomonadota bacterium]